jgi:hypothetical protein
MITKENEILIVFSDDSDISSVNFYIDDNLTKPTLIDNTAVFDLDIDAGIHMLKLTLKKDAHVEIKDFRLDGVTIREYLYMSFMEAGGKKYQPCCELTTTDHVWRLPFANPMSLWYTLCTRKFSNKLFGTNLYDRFEIVYPDRIDPGPDYPTIIRDFFNHNFDFQVYEKSKLDNPWHTRDIPYFKVALNYDHAAIEAELFENIDSILPRHLEVVSHRALKGAKNVNQWAITHTITWKDKNNPKHWRDRVVWPILERMPNLLKYYESLEVDEIYSANIGWMPPGGFGSPHIDIDDPCGWTDEEYIGLSNLYVPFRCSDGMYFKLGNSYVPLDAPTAINNFNFTHALFNGSKNLRLTLGTTVKAESNKIKAIK